MRLTDSEGNLTLSAYLDKASGTKIAMAQTAG